MYVGDGLCAIPLESRRFKIPGIGRGRDGTEAVPYKKLDNNLAQTTRKLCYFFIGLKTHK